MLILLTFSLIIFHLNKPLKIENIFPDKGPITGRTRVVIFNKDFYNINIKKYVSPKVNNFFFPF